MEVFVGRTEQFGTPSVNIDVGRYNLYLVDKKVDELQEQLGNLVDAKELKNQLIEASGIATENSLTAANRKETLAQNVSGLLNEGDVQALTDIYIYAKEKGLDTNQVNHLGFFLGVYRNSQDTLYHPPSELADADTIKQAEAIYSSKGGSVAQLDSGFLEAMLNPYKALNSFSELVDLDFLEEITGSGEGGAFAPTELYLAEQTKAETNNSVQEEALTKDELKEQLTAWLNQHWAEQASITSQLLGLNEPEQQNIWAQLREMFIEFA